MKKTIFVVAALIRKDNHIFAAKRAYGFLKGKWELPGGKIEKGESKKEALQREIKEELSTDIKINKFLLNVIYEYPEFILDMDVYDCSIVHGRLSLDLNIHSEEAFLDISSLNLDDWCPADREVLLKIRGG